MPCRTMPMRRCPLSLGERVRVRARPSDVPGRARATAISLERGAAGHKTPPYDRSAATAKHSSFDRLRMSGVILAVLCLAAVLTHEPLRPSGGAQALGLPQGWNLVAIPGGMVTSGPVYTYQIGDAGYETIP